MTDKWKAWKQAVAAEQSGEDAPIWVLRRMADSGEAQWCRRVLVAGEVWITLWSDAVSARPLGRQAADFLAEYCASQSARGYMAPKWITYVIQEIEP